MGYRRPPGPSTIYMHSLCQELINKIIQAGGRGGGGGGVGEERVFLKIFPTGKI
jgi:hypothetical protein